MATHELNAHWRLDLDPANPQSFRIYHADGKFFEIRFNPAKWGQPMLYEKADANGITGKVIALVRKIAEGWQVATVRVQRPCDDYVAQQLEGLRYSISNANPTIVATNCPLTLADAKPTHFNSARIVDKTEIGVIDVTDVVDFALPAGASWCGFGEFFQESTDTMTKAVLGHFLVVHVIK